MRYLNDVKLVPSGPKCRRFLKIIHVKGIKCFISLILLVEMFLVPSEPISISWLSLFIDTLQKKITFFAFRFYLSLKFL